MKCNKNIIKIFLPVLLLSLFLAFTFSEAAMNDYCVTPPFLAQSIPPNVLIVLDNSLSMFGQAYAGSYDPTQFTSGYYYGYFDPTKNYQYLNTGRWEETAAAMTTGTAANPIASGNFLNWAVMRRVEVSKKLLVGGKKSLSSNNWLDGETASSMWDFDKDFDNTSTPNLIYPFTGNYRYKRVSDALNITPVTAGTNTETKRPTSNVSVPAAWTVFPAATAAWADVDEATADDDSTYIKNTTSNTNDQAIFGYDRSAFTISGTITDVTIVVRAKKAASGTMRIQGALQSKTAGADLITTSSYSNLSTSYSNYQFSWATNPANCPAGVCQPWTFADLTGNAVGSLFGFGVKAYTQPDSSQYPTVTQVYMIVTVSNPTGGPYTIRIVTPTEQTGIIHTLSGDVRFGLAYYQPESDNGGGEVNTYVGFGTPQSMITSINGMTPATYTPLGETLYEMINYFRQDNPYYSNSPADYSKGASGANIIRDPFWYKYTDLSASLTDQYVPCAKSFILFLTDGESTQDQSLPGTSTTTPFAECSSTNIKACSGHTPAGYTPAGLLLNPRFAGTSVGTSYALSGTDYMIDAASWGRTTDARPGACTTTPTDWAQCIPGTQNIYLYSVFMFGSGSTLLKDAAIYGGFNDLNNNNIPDCTTLPAECYRDSSNNGTIASDGTDLPLTYYEGNDGYELQVSITNAISAILKRASSGTAASVLASGEGSGANIVQAIFYPKRMFGTTEIDWTSTLQNLWYYLDPGLGSSTIREDTAPADNELELEKDYIVHFAFDATEQKTKASLYTSDIHGTQGTLVSTIPAENLKYLWEAGSILHSRVISGVGADPRTIYTTTTGAYNSLIPFTTTNAATLQTLLQASDLANSQNIITYVRGDSDLTSRNRTVTNGATTGIWRLGDIVNSTPRLASWIPLHNFHKAELYNDTTYKSFIDSSTYTSRGMAFVGGNDGMLHAFKLGTLELVKDATSTKARLTGSNLGREEWAFIPENSLPYLKYLMDPAYCHLFYIDSTPFIFDASIKRDDTATNVAECTATDTVAGVFDTDTSHNYWSCKKTVNSWRTILIGGMRLGGACKTLTYAGTQGVKAPIKACSNDTTISCSTDAVCGAGTCLEKGYSTYFALDITDTSDPKLLWEFTDPALGFSTSGPVVMRINARTVSGSTSTADNGDKNGKWFVVFASGPTGPIDTTAHQFKAFSDQNLKLFVVDIKTGAHLRTIDTGIANAFGGSLSNAGMDYDFDYQDDALYMGYTSKCSATTPGCSLTDWSQGGVIRLITKENLDGTNLSVTAGTTALNPSNWAVSHVAKDIGAVTSAIAHIAHYPENVRNPDKAYLFFGTGRYFYKTTETDNANVQRSLFGIQEPCLAKLIVPKACTGTSNPCTTDANCTGIQTCDYRSCDDSSLVCSGGGDLVDKDDDADILANHQCLGPATTDKIDPSAYPAGWYINLDPSSGTVLAERNITDPLATSIGAVFFTTYAPNSDICSYGGSSYLWGLRYDTGGTINGMLEGKGLLQVSTGAIEEVDLATAFVDKLAGGRSGEGRRTGSLTGAPPTGQGLALVVPPQPLKKMMHIRKK